MAVQKKRMTRAKRDQRRGQDKAKTFEVSIDQETGEAHRRHHITAEGFYRGKRVIMPPKVDLTPEEE